MNQTGKETLDRYRNRCYFFNFKYKPCSHTMSSLTFKNGNSIDLPIELQCSLYRKLLKKSSRTCRSSYMVRVYFNILQADETSQSHRVVYYMKEIH